MKSELMNFAYCEPCSVKRDAGFGKFLDQLLIRADCLPVVTIVGLQFAGKQKRVIDQERPRVLVDNLEQNLCCLGIVSLSAEVVRSRKPVQGLT